WDVSFAAAPAQRRRAGVPCRRARPDQRRMRWRSGRKKALRRQKPRRGGDGIGSWDPRRLAPGTPPGRGSVDAVANYVVMTNELQGINVTARSARSGLVAMGGALDEAEIGILLHVETVLHEAELDLGVDVALEGGQIGYGVGVAIIVLPGHE